MAANIEGPWRQPPTASDSDDEGEIHEDTARSVSVPRRVEVPDYPNTLLPAKAPSSSPLSSIHHHNMTASASQELASTHELTVPSSPLRSDIRPQNNPFRTITDSPPPAVSVHGTEGISTSATTSPRRSPFMPAKPVDTVQEAPTPAFTGHLQEIDALQTGQPNQSVDKQSTLVLTPPPVRRPPTNEETDYYQGLAGGPQLLSPINGSSVTSEGAGSLAVASHLAGTSRQPNMTSAPASSRSSSTPAGPRLPTKAAPPEGRNGGLHMAPTEPRLSPGTALADNPAGASHVASSLRQLIAKAPPATAVTGGKCRAPVGRRLAAQPSSVRGVNDGRYVPTAGHHLLSASRAPRSLAQPPTSNHGATAARRLRSQCPPNYLQDMIPHEFKIIPGSTQNSVWLGVARYRKYLTGDAYMDFDKYLNRGYANTTAKGVGRLIREELIKQTPECQAPGLTKEEQVELMALSQIKEIELLQSGQANDKFAAFRAPKRIKQENGLDVRTNHLYGVTHASKTANHPTSSVQDVQTALNAVKEQVARIANANWDQPQAAAVWGQVISEDLRKASEMLHLALKEEGSA